MKRKSHLHSWFRRDRRGWQWLLFLVVLLVVTRAALPFAVKAYVNRELDAAHDYTGKIGGVDIRLWRGGYRIHQVEILKRTCDVPSPLFSAKQMDFTIDWRELFHGAVVGEVFFLEPRVNFVSSTNAQQVQNGKDESWDKLLQSLFPFHLNRVGITNGEIHFQNPSSEPPVDIYLSRLSATATNLTNTRDLKGKLPAGLVASGSTMGGGRLDLEMKMNPLKATPTYEINCALTNANLTALNDFLRAYGKFDVERGTFSLYTSVAAEGGAYTVSVHTSDSS
jgi:hypothetical protein